MKKVYYPMETFNEDTQGFYKEFEVADDFPQVADFVYTQPDESIKYPVFNTQLGRWEEDKGKVIADLTQQITDLQEAVATDFETGVVENGEDLPSAN